MVQEVGGVVQMVRGELNNNFLLMMLAPAGR